MEIPGASVLTTLAKLAMAFTAFTSIVIILRKGTGKPISPLHILFTSVYVELGLMSTTFALLAPVIALYGMREILIWQISSAIMLAILVPWLFIYPVRRRVAAPDEKMPTRWHVMFSVGMLVAIGLCLNIVGWPLPPGPGPLALTSVYLLGIAAVIFLRNYLSYFRD